MYLAYVHLKIKEELKCFAIIGKDIDSILLNAMKFGTEPVVCSELFKLNKDW